MKNISFLLYFFSKETKQRETERQTKTWIETERVEREEVEDEEKEGKEEEEEEMPCLRAIDVEYQ